MSVTRLDHLVIAVSDWDRANRFYESVLGTITERRGAGYAYRVGQQRLNVHGPGVDATPLARHPVAPGGSDLCFEWDGPIDEAVGHLTTLGVAVEVGPIERNGSRGPGQSVYFRDPDGSLLEFISYRQNRGTA